MNKMKMRTKMKKMKKGKGSKKTKMKLSSLAAESATTPRAAVSQSTSLKRR